MPAKSCWMPVKLNLWYFVLNLNLRSLSPFLKSWERKSTPALVFVVSVHLDKHLNWKPLISDIANIWMLSKLRHYLPLKILIKIYHSIFASHIRYSIQIWGLCDTTNSHQILTLQKTALSVHLELPPILFSLSLEFLKNVLTSLKHLFCPSTINLIKIF